MSENEVGNCPKCGGAMKKGKLLGRVNPIKHYDIIFEDAAQKKLIPEKKWLVAYACEKCGFIESYVSKTGDLS